MKLQEVLNEEELDEKHRDVIAAGMIAVASLSPSLLKDPPPPEHTAAQTLKWKKQKAMEEIEVLAASIQKKYRIDKAHAKEIVQIAKKYEKAKFPRATDILSVIGVESSFKSTSVSSLKNDPAVGLMQVRPKVWGLEKSDLATIDSQIKFGSEVLTKYYAKLGSEDDALHAFNVGITNFRKGTGLNPKYVDKVNREQSWYKKLLDKLEA